MSDAEHTGDVAYYFFDGTYNYDYVRHRHLPPSTVFHAPFLERQGRYIPKGLSKENNLETFLPVAEAILASDKKRFVIFSGTDSMEEYAYFMELVCPIGKGVIFTGAMYPFGHPNYDGLANFEAVKNLPTSLFSEAGGAYILMNRKIYRAAHTQKWHSTSPDAFHSDDALVASYDAASQSWCFRAHQEASATNRDVVPLSRFRLDANIPILTVSLGDTFDYLDTSRVDGLVVAGSGTGSLPHRTFDTLSVLAKKMPVVIVSRCPSGPNFDDDLYPGSREKYEAAGFLVQDYSGLNSLKARILLMSRL